MNTIRRTFAVSAIASILILPVVSLAADAPAKLPGAQPSRVAAPLVISPAYEAYVQGTAKRQGSVAAGGLSWQCGGSRCSANTGTVAALDACKALAREIGAMKSFKRAGKALSTADLGACNAAAQAVYALQPQSGAIRFGDGQHGKRPAAGRPDTTGSLPAGAPAGMTPIAGGSDEPQLNSSGGGPTLATATPAPGIRMQEGTQTQAPRRAVIPRIRVAQPRIRINGSAGPALRLSGIGGFSIEYDLAALSLKSAIPGETTLLLQPMIASSLASGLCESRNIPSAPAGLRYARSVDAPPGSSGRISVHGARPGQTYEIQLCVLGVETDPPNRTVRVASNKIALEVAAAARAGGDFELSRLSLAGRKIAITIRAGESQQGMKPAVQLLDAESGRELWRGSATIARIFGSYGSLVTTDYELPRGHRQRLTAKILLPDDNLANNSRTETIGPASAPLYVARGAVRARAANSIREVVVTRRGDDWMELTVATDMQADAGVLQLAVQGLASARCADAAGRSRITERDTAMPLGRGNRSFRFFCQAAPQDATGAVLAILRVGGREASRHRTPWTVRAGTANIDRRAARAGERAQEFSGTNNDRVDIEVTRAQIHIRDGVPYQLLVTLRNNGSVAPGKPIQVDWNLFTNETQVTRGYKSHTLAIRNGETETLSFRIANDNSFQGWRWLPASTGQPPSYIRVHVDSLGALLEPDERNNRRTVRVVDPAFGGFYAVRR